MNKKAFVFLVFAVVVVAPWIWINGSFGMENIPHYDLTMWSFMLNYLLLAVLGFAGILAFFFAGDDQPRVRDVIAPAHIKSVKSLQSSADGSYVDPVSLEVKVPEEITEEEAPDELQDQAVEYPAEWDERKFE